MNKRIRPPSDHTQPVNLHYSSRQYKSNSQQTVWLGSLLGRLIIETANKETVCLGSDCRKDSQQTNSLFWIWPLSRSQSTDKAVWLKSLWKPFRQSTVKHSTDGLTRVPFSIAIWPYSVNTTLTTHKFLATEVIFSGFMFFFCFNICWMLNRWN